jgi:hypothetical protein
MTHKDDAAFSRSATYNEHTYTINSAQYGLTKREYFAAMAMQGMLSNQHGYFLEHDKLSEYALSYADALIKELNK